MSLLLLFALLQDPVPLDDLHRRFDFSWKSDPATGRETLSAGAHDLVLVPGLDLAFVDGAVRKIPAPVLLRDGRLLLPPDLATWVRSSFPPRTATVEKKKEPETKAPKPSVGWDPSPNYDRGVNRTVSRIVIHTTEGSLSGCLSWFRDPRSRVSAHFVVARDGRIIQTVREEDVAWHAGSEYNPTTIGIEHEGYSDRNLWTPEQMSASAALARYLCDRYSIPPDRAHIVSHESLAPDRRRDPGRFFDWDRYLALIARK